jgi:nucleotide-binding universal stress UspA family protein
MNEPLDKIHPAQILLGVDGSDQSLVGVSLLRELPCVPRCRIHAITVWNGRSPVDRARLQAALNEVQEKLRGGCAEVHAELCQGHAAEVIVRTAADLECDLIVVGAKGLRSTLGILLGGVAQQVVEHAHCPVLVVRAPSAGLGQVLLVTDGSDSSQAAAEYLANLSLPAETKVRVCNVVPPGALPQFTTGTWPVGHEVVPILSDRELDELEKMHEEERVQARKLVTETSIALGSAGLDAEGLVLEGDAATEILRYARRWHPNLIVAGSRGLSEIKGWWMGSVSRKLVNAATCSVLVVKRAGEADQH